MNASILVVVPPLIVVLGAFITQRFLTSLLLGIISASLIACNFDPGAALWFIGSKISRTLEFHHFVSWDLFWRCEYVFILLFLLVLGFFIVMMQRSGATHAYSAFAMRFVKKQADVERASLLLSFMFFIDDYFSCLTVGSAMQSLFDKFKLPRAKLAFFVSVVAAPFAVLIPLSSWVAYIIGQLRSAGVSLTGNGAQVIAADGFQTYLQAIPFLFYPLLVIGSMFFLTYSRFSYGIRAKQEEQAALDGNLFGGKMAKIQVSNPAEAFEHNGSARLSDFLFPLFLLFFFVVGIVFYTGGLLQGASPIEAIRKGNIFSALFLGSVLSAFVSFVYLVLRKRFGFSAFWSLCKEGYGLMITSIFMLILIWTLGSILEHDLATGQYLANQFAPYMALEFVPLMFFLLTGLVSVLIGTAWGTIGMMIPLMVSLVPTLVGVSYPVALIDIPLLLPALGAIISGAMMTNHMSPLSDVMLMSATSTGAYHLDVVKTQASFTIPTMISSAVAFLCTGLLLNAYSPIVVALLSLLAGFACNFALLGLLTFGWRWMKKS